MADKEPEPALADLQTLFNQYKQIEASLQQNRIRLGNKLPDIKRALDTVQMLCDKRGTGEELNMNFELVDSVYAKAVVKDAESVYLWLGANVMLEYPLDEAKARLGMTGPHTTAFAW
jgi:prefoldin subunit 5